MMKYITNNPRAAALIGFLLAMPLMLLLWIMLYEVEPCWIGVPNCD
jgi:hypothetical protein